MKTRNKILLTAGVIVVGASVAAIGLVARTAFAAPAGPDPSDGKAGTRAGIKYEGCDHFELVDEDALRGWITANSWRFLTWLKDLEATKANPEPFLVDMFGTIFPECSWPPPPATTFGPQRGTWADAVSEIKAMAGLEGSAASDAGAANDLARTFFGR